jgi:DNA polymerase-3 subunit delta'
MAPRVPKGEIENYPESDRSGDLLHPREQALFFGHSSSIAELSTAARSGQMHHAWLIAGPKGIGKATLAWKFSKALLAFGTSGCPQDLSVPETNTFAKQVSALTHPDLILLRRPWDHEKKRFKSELPVAEIRKLGSFYSTHASYGGSKIAIVDCMDETSPEAQNALLKVLEEPPKGAVLLLITHAPGHLLPTIRSRCRTLTLRKLGSVDMHSALAALCPHLHDEDRQLILALADGAPGFAASLVAANASSTYKDVLTLLHQLPKPNMSHSISLSERLAKLPIDQGIGLFSTLLTLAIQRAVQANLVQQPVLPVEEKVFTSMFAAMSPQTWVQSWSDLRHAFARTDQLNLDKKQYVLNAIFSLESKATSLSR